MGMDYQEVEIGMTAESPHGRTISEADVYTFPVGTYNPVHTDEEFIEDSEWDAPIAQNSLLLSVMGALNFTLPWDIESNVAYGKDNYRFINPVYIGDTVSLESEVIDKRDKNDQYGIVRFKVELYKSEGEIAVSGENLNLVRKASD